MNLSLKAKDKSQSFVTMVYGLENHHNILDTNAKRKWVLFILCNQSLEILEIISVSLKEPCATLNLTRTAYYYDGKCFVREGLRDLSKNRKCNLLPNGHLMTQKTQEELTQIVDALKDMQLINVSLNKMLCCVGSW